MLEFFEKIMKTKKDEDNLSKVQDYLVDELGNYIGSLGGKTLLGRIWGLLLTSEGPISLKDLTKKLRVSKPAISSTVNIGLQYEIFSKYYNRDFPRENFIKLNFNTMDMLINPGKHKLTYLFEKFEKSVELLNNVTMPQTASTELNLISNRLNYLTECFKIFLDDYKKMTEGVIKKCKILEKKYKIGVNNV